MIFRFSGPDTYLPDTVYSSYYLDSKKYSGFWYKPTYPLIISHSVLLLGRWKIQNLKEERLYLYTHLYPRNSEKIYIFYRVQMTSCKIFFPWTNFLAIPYHFLPLMIVIYIPEEANKATANASCYVVTIKPSIEFEGFYSKLRKQVRFRILVSVISISISSVSSSFMC